jgi:NADH-quinone oxidoreductase subunit N
VDADDPNGITTIMNFSELINRLVQDTVGAQSLWKSCQDWFATQQMFHNSSLLMFAPELILSATIVLLLMVRICSLDRFLPGSSVSLFGACIALGATVMQFLELRVHPENGGVTFFTGLMIYDQFTVFFRIFLGLFLLLVIYLTRLSGIPDRDDSPDFYTLLIGSTIGMMLMASSNNMLMLFLGIEMTSVPSYVMVGFLKGRRTSSEAAFKYVVYGAGAAGVMLYGISLLCGLLGTANFPEMAERLSAIASQGVTLANPSVRVLSLSLLMIMVGFCFKLSLFPFHFWCPDAFEGASAEVAGFLSVGSKAGAFALLVRLCLALVGVQNMVDSQFSTVLSYFGLGLGVIAAVSATFGNLAAYGQTNMKRMLAYSTIAHAGYMLMAVSAMMVLLNGHSTKHIDFADRIAPATSAIQGLLYYLWVYMFMNLGAFAIVAMIRNEIFSEEIEDYSGLAYRAPVLATAMGACLFSLVGIPPLGGFFGKFAIFSAVLQATTYHWFMWVVLAAGGINTVFSLVYYIRVLRIMFMGQPTEQSRNLKFPLFTSSGLYVTGIALVVLLMGIIVEPMSATAKQIATMLFP